MEKEMEKELIKTILNFKNIMIKKQKKNIKIKKEKEMNIIMMILYYLRENI